MPLWAVDCLRLSLNQFLLRAPSSLLYFLGERVRGQVDGSQMVPFHPPVDMRFGTRITLHEDLFISVYAEHLLIEGFDYDEFCRTHLMPREIPVRGRSAPSRGRQTHSSAMPSSHGSVSHTAMGASSSGAGASTTAGLDSAYWAPGHLDYLRADF